MKKLLYIFSLAVLFSSCRAGLDELPLYEDSEILSFKLARKDVIEKDPEGKNVHGYPKVVITNYSDKQVSLDIDKEAKTVKLVVTADVNLKNVIGICSISRAATIKPTGDSPKLGFMANWTKPHTYRVTAADDSFHSDWTITVTNQKP
ncbi:MAG: hypothetical protein MI784_11240 [Cytophagales bacterium]|nr:hypothetical protein [Cytophagales bacterium]